MTNSDDDGRIFLYYPRTNSGFTILLTIKPAFLKAFRSSSDKPHFMMTHIHITMMSLVFWRAAVRFLSFAPVGTGYVR